MTDNLLNVQQTRRVSGSVAYKLFSNLIDLIFPPRCVGCGRVDTHWCEMCHTEFVETPVYNTARHIPENLTGIATTTAHHGKVQKLIHGLKYQNRREFAVILGERLATQAEQQGWAADAVLAVPMHARRLRQRGYNQAQLLAEQVAQQLELPELTPHIYREQYTRSQVGLGRAERLTNVAEAFRADPDVFQGKTLILVDDVFTTGATLQACAQTLRENGAVAVYGLTVTAAV